MLYTNKVDNLEELKIARNSFPSLGLEVIGHLTGQLLIVILNE